MKRTLLTVITLCALLFGAATHVAAEQLFAITGGLPPFGTPTNPQQLLTFDSAEPSTITSTQTITGFVEFGEFIRGIDVRPVNGHLYGLSNRSRLYTINTATGEVTFVATLSTTLVGGDSPLGFGIDFNPVPDRLRVITDSGQNLRVNPDTGEVTQDGQLNYAAGDANAGRVPRLGGAAYTNSVAGATSTTLFNIETNVGVLVTQNPPNDGVLNTVGPLGVNFRTGTSSFEISAATGTAYAALSSVVILPTPSVLTQLYTISLETGAATLVGRIGDGSVPIIGVTTAGVAEVECVTDLTAQVTSFRSGVIFNPFTRRFVQLVVLRNNSSTPLPGPVALALDNLREGVTVVGADGVTGCAEPAGSPYVNVNVGRNGVFGPGEVTSVLLQFTNATPTVPITYQVRVLAGSISR